MRYLILLKAICEWYNEHGRAVATHELTERDCIINKWSSAKFYRTMKTLIEMGFVIRTMRGFYMPLDIYQHTAEALLEQIG